MARVALHATGRKTQATADPRAGVDPLETLETKERYAPSLDRLADADGRRCIASKPGLYALLTQ
jgi:hypothetical protein